MLNLRHYARSLPFSVALGCATLGCADAADWPPGAVDETLDAGAAPGPAPAMAFDVAENAARFAFDDQHQFADGLPAYGSVFVTQGYLYPEGFLSQHAGVLDDGSPTDPKAVIGEWTCRGWFIGDGLHTERGTAVASTQIYDFYESPGYREGQQSSRSTVITNGYEVVDLGVPVRRAITGGTGEHAGARGEMAQTLLGMNPSQGVDLRVHFFPL